MARIASSLSLLGLSLSGLVFAVSSQMACSSSSDTPPPANTPDVGVDTGTIDVGSDAGGDPALAIPCPDTLDSIYGDPGKLPDAKGAIIRCSKADPISKGDLQAKADKNGYKGAPFTSGAKVYRVLYRTERGNDAPGTSSAIVYLPDTPAAAKVPLVVATHGARGQAPTCTPSKFTPDGEFLRADFETLVFPLVGAGLAVIAPDYAGYANHGATGNPASQFAGAADIGKSVLDATRAMRKMAPSVLDDKVMFYGHSQGGHAALSAHALSATYGIDGKLAGTVVFAPLWISQVTWGALLLVGAGYPFKDFPNVNASGVWYHYTKAELLDGPGKGLELFAADKRAAIKKFVETACWQEKQPQLEALGTNITDLFDPAFADAVKTSAAAGAPCPTAEPGKSICEKWMPRYKADRPHIQGDAAKVPILFLYGGKDSTIPAARMACGIERLKTDGASVTYCLEPDLEHPTILSQRSSYAVDWMKSQTMGTPAPAACPKTEKDLVDETGAPAKCETPPPND